MIILRYFHLSQEIIYEHVLWLRFWRRNRKSSFNLINKIENQADHVMRFAYCLTLNMSDSEDLCQQVFKEAVQKGLSFWEWR